MIELNRPSTIVDPRKPLVELAEISRNGYSLDREEFLEGMIAIAGPVTDPMGGSVASVAFHAPVQRVPIDAAIAMKGRMLDASRQLTQAIFGPESV